MKRLHGENGVELLEFALVIPIFVFVLYGLIAFGMMLSAKQTVTNAAAEGARAAVGASGDPVAAARSKVGSAMASYSGYNVQDPKQFDGQVAACDPVNSPAGPKCITVKVTYPYGDKPLIPPAPGLGLVMPSTLSSTAVVQVS
jgi:Flp pilus assembly protein TadG